MKDIRGKIEGDLTLSEDADVHALVAGSLHVEPNVRCELHGLVERDVHVSAGASVIIHGTVVGAVVNHGEVEIFGAVGSVAGSGASVVSPGAVVGAFL